MSTGAPGLFMSQKKEQAGAPFPAGAANNGLSVDPITGKIVLGNDQPGVSATLLSNREIPLAGFNISFSNIGGNTFADVRGSGIFRVHDAAFDQDTAINKGSIQITDNIGGGAAIQLISTAGQILARKVGNTQVFSIDDGAGSPLRLLHLDFNNSLAALGDFNGVNSGTYLLNDDGNRRLQWFVKVAGVGKTFLDLNEAADGYRMGDIGNVLGGQKLTMASGQFVFQKLSKSFLELDTVLGTYKIGDINSLLNGTQVFIDDFNQLIKLNKNTALAAPSDTTQRISIKAQGNGILDGFFLETLNAADFVRIGAGQLRSSNVFDISSFANGVTVSPNLTTEATFNNVGLTLAKSIKTGDPGLGAGTWKLGVVVAAASALDATRYVQVSIGGVVVKLAVIS